MTAITTRLRQSALAPVLEVFASIQGEGRHVGEPQVFLRLFGCPLRCRWCDTPGSWLVPEEPRARIAARERARRDSAWVSPFQAATWIAEVEPGKKRTVSVTGGEPLLWPAFVKELRRYVGPRRVHLETAGAHPQALEEVIDSVDHVSLDLKLFADLDPPVEVPSGGEPAPASALEWSPERAPSSALEWSTVRARVLELVRGKDACGKLIVAGNRRALDFRVLLDDVAAIAPELPLVIQPVTPVNGVPAPGPELLAELVELALERALLVRVVPQIHRVLSVP